MAAPDDATAAVGKLSRHQLDLLLDLRTAGAPAHYWVNPDSPKGYITGAEWNWLTVYTQHVKDAQSGAPFKNFVRGGLKEGFVKSSPYGGMVPEAARKQAESIRAAKQGRTPDPLSQHYPTAVDGLRSIAAIKACVDSAKNHSAWRSLGLSHSRHRR